MQLEDRQAAYFWDMLEVAREVVDMMADQDRENFMHNRVLQRATERCVEIIGEVARRVSPDIQEKYSVIPWRAIIGQRNILAHEYGQIDYAILYRTVIEDIPALIKQLHELLPPLDDGVL